MAKVGRKKGQKHYKWDETAARTVETMAGFGVPQDYIAGSLKITDDTLRRHYRKELDSGTAKANMAVAQSLYRKAISDDHPQAASSAMFWLKTRAGWKETHKIEGEVNHTITKIERVIIDNSKKQIEHDPKEPLIEVKPKAVEFYDEDAD